LVVLQNVKQSNYNPFWYKNDHKNAKMTKKRAFFAKNDIFDRNRGDLPALKPSAEAQH
jgi:hypothetical protein